MASLPRITAPAARSLATTVASSAGRKPRCIAMPAAVGASAVQQRSFTASGTPWSGPRLVPAAISASATLASASALSGMTQFETVQLAVERRDTIQHRPRELDRRQRLGAEFLRDFGQSGEGQCVIHAGSLLATR